MSNERILELIETQDKYYVLDFINGIKANRDELLKENEELKRQLEENKNPLKGIFAQVNDDMLLRNCGAMHSEIEEYKNQQKEFIEWLEENIKACELTSDLIFNHNKEMKIYKEIISKYREIIGGNKDEK